MPTQDLARFRASMTDPGPSDETYDLGAFRALGTAEGKTAIEETVLAAQSGDRRAIWTLGIIGDGSAKPVLLSLAGSTGTQGLVARRALAEMGYGQAVLTDLIADAQGSGSYGQIAALQSIAKVDGDDADKALLNALSDEDDTVRSVAFDLLVARSQLSAACLDSSGAEALASPLGVLQLLLENDLAAIHQGAASILRAHFRGALRGTSATALGLIYDGGTPGLRSCVGIYT